MRNIKVKLPDGHVIWLYNLRNEVGYVTSWGDIKILREGSSWRLYSKATRQALVIEPHTFKRLDAAVFALRKHLDIARDLVHLFGEMSKLVPEWIRKLRRAMGDRAEESQWFAIYCDFYANSHPSNYHAARERGHWPGIVADDIVSRMFGVFSSTPLTHGPAPTSVHTLRMLSPLFAQRSARYFMRHTKLAACVIRQSRSRSRRSGSRRAMQASGMPRLSGHLRCASMSCASQVVQT
jgi:hypothetical protein